MRKFQFLILSQCLYQTFEYLMKIRSGVRHTKAGAVVYEMEQWLNGTRVLFTTLYIFFVRRGDRGCVDDKCVINPCFPPEEPVYHLCGSDSFPSETQDQRVTSNLLVWNILASKHNLSSAGKQPKIIFSFDCS